MNDRIEIAVSSNGQIAEWSLARAPLQHLTQNELDSLIERIDAYIYMQVDSAERGAR
jgi:hypothetical protein